LGGLLLGQLGHGDIVDLAGAKQWNFLEPRTSLGIHQFEVPLDLAKDWEGGARGGRVVVNRISRSPWRESALRLRRTAPAATAQRQQLHRRREIISPPLWR